MLRGEAWWAELDGDAGFRPVVILSRSEGMERRHNVIMAEVTRAMRSIPCEVLLTRADGMSSDCVINTDNLYTIPRDRLKQRITMLSDERLFALTSALRYSLEMDW